MQTLKIYQQADLNVIIKTRVGETKLGEKINLNWQDNEVKFVLLGIAEDIGVQVNRGIGGTHTAWNSFLNAFLNIQSTKVLSGNEIGIYGCLSFDDLKPNSESVEIIDNENSEVKSYDYLVRMQIVSLTGEKIDELNKQKDEKQRQLDMIKSKTEKDLWRDDLQDISKMI